MTSTRKFDRLLTSTKFQDPLNFNKSFSFDVSNLTSDIIITIPNGTTEMIGNDGIQILTNKTIDADLNTILNIDNSNIKSNASIDATKIANGTISNSEFEFLNGVSSNVVGISDTQILTNKTLTDSTTFFQDDIDNSKKIKFQLSGISTGTIRILSIPDADTIIVGTNVSQILTNKTIDASFNTVTNLDNTNIKVGATIDASKIANGTISNIEFQFLNGLTSSVVGINDIQTLTNKTFSDNLNMNSNKIINVATPTSPTDAVNKAYVDNRYLSSDFKDSVVVATTGDLNTNTSISGSVTYTATGGSSTKGIFTGTLSSSNSFIIDGRTFTNSDNGKRVLIKDQINEDENGIYTVTISSTSLTLDRAPDFDEDSEVSGGLVVFVEEGSANSETGWILATNDPITVGGTSGTSLLFVQFTGSATLIAGTGLTKIGDTINANGSNTIIANSNNLEVNSSAVSGQVLLSTGTIGTASTFGAISLNNINSITGILPISYGGTNVSSFSSGDNLIATNSGNTGLVATGINPTNIQIKIENSITTTNNTITTIATIATTSDVTYLLEASIVADNTIASESAGFIVNSLLRNDAGTLTLVANDILELKDLLPWSVSVEVSGVNILIRVKGDVATTIDWKSRYITLTV